MSHIYSFLCMLNKDLCELSAPKLCQRGDMFPENKMESIYDYVLDLMLTLDLKCKISVL